MKLRLIGMLLLLLLTAVIPAPAPQAYSQRSSAPLVIIHANLIDGLSPQPIRDATVIVRDGKIEKVATGPVELPAGATVLDLKGRWLLPGLIDAHVHLRQLSSARTALASGVTTARCLGVERFTDVGIRALNHEGIADLPDVVAAGYGITTRPNELFLLDFPKMNDLTQGVNGTESVRRMVRALAGRGVNVIKVLPLGEPVRHSLTRAGGRLQMKNSRPSLTRRGSSGYPWRRTRTGTRGRRAPSARESARLSMEPT